MWLTALLCWLAAGGVAGYGMGAPRSACDSLRPAHSGGDPRRDPAPFDVDVSGGDTYWPGESLMVTIEAEDYARFRGFILQARRLDTDEAVGEFATNHICDQSTATHWHKGRKSRVELRWRAPDWDVGGIRFQASIVQDYNTYWTDVFSDVLHAPAPPPPARAAPLPACMEANLTALEDERPLLAMLCSEDGHCPCGWHCCPLTVCPASRELPHFEQDESRELHDSDELHDSREDGPEDPNWSICRKPKGLHAKKVQFGGI